METYQLNLGLSPSNIRELAEVLESRHGTGDPLVKKIEKAVLDQR